MTRKKNVPVDRTSLCNFLTETLNLTAIADFSCNGLQVEGSAEVKRIALAVDACMESYRYAVKHSCDMLLVHHGIIWGGLTKITGPVHTQIKYLIAHDINLFAAHLPLDLHQTLGNNAQLAELLGLKKRTPFGLYKGVTIGFEGIAPSGTTLDSIVDRLCRKLDTECTVLPFGNEKISRIAIVSGGGSAELGEAIEKGVDCFITGESSHENYHAALEAKINVIYAGHYHTEKVGVQAVGALLEKQFGIETFFCDVPTAI
jgi:dinuclear metal center YbgI/SA1388 family protein